MKRNGNYFLSSALGHPTQKYKYSIYAGFQRLFSTFLKSAEVRKELQEF